MRRRAPGAVADFVELVAHIKHSVHFQALYEGGPQLVIQLYLVVREWDTLSVQLAALEVDAWLRLFSPSFSATGLVMSQMDFLCENDRFTRRIWRRDAPPVMMAVMCELTAHLVLRVFPLVVLLDCHPYAGLGAAACWMFVACAVTWASDKDAQDADQNKCDLVLSSFLFFPHAFFFAMTCEPHHEPHPSLT